MPEIGALVVPLTHNVIYNIMQKVHSYLYKDTSDFYVTLPWNFEIGIFYNTASREVTLTMGGELLKNWAKFTLKILWSPLLSGPEILRSPPFCHINILLSPIQGMPFILYDCSTFHCGQQITIDIMSVAVKQG